MTGIIPHMTFTEKDDRLIKILERGDKRFLRAFEIEDGRYCIRLTFPYFLPNVAVYKLEKDLRDIFTWLHKDHT